MAAPKKRKIPASKLTKAKKPPRASTRMKRYHMTIGGKHSPGPQRDFVEIAEMKREATKAFEEWVPWCKRHNSAGREALFDAKRLVSEYFAVSPTPVAIEAMYDEHYQMTIVVTMWRD